MSPRAWRAATLVAALGACAPPEATPSWRLDTFRLLGVGAQPVWPVMGSSTHLTLASADIRTRPVDAVWFRCDPVAVTATSADPAADSLASACPGLVPLGTGTSVTLDVPATGTVATGGPWQIPVVGFACAGGAIRLPSESGDPWPRCVGTDAVGWPFFATIRVRRDEHDVDNTDPTLDDVRLTLPSGETQSLLPASPAVLVPRCVTNTSCAPLPLNVTFGPDSVEAYLDPASGRTMYEYVGVYFLADDGTLGADQALLDEPPFGTATVLTLPPNSFMPPDHAGTVHLWVYASDQRGGFMSRAVSIEVQ